jgi:hypothetical protein
MRFEEDERTHIEVNGLAMAVGWLSESLLATFQAFLGCDSEAFADEQQRRLFPLRSPLDSLQRSLHLQQPRGRIETPGEHPADALSRSSRRPHSR